MKTFVSLIILIFIVIGISSSQTTINLDTDPELKKAWIIFKEAVKNSDKTQLKIICADSVIFSMVIGDMKMLSSSADEVPDEKTLVDNSMHTNYFYLSFESFFQDEMQFVFDSNVISRMDDISMLRIVKTKGSESEYKFFITVTDPDEEFSGVEMALRFKKVPTGYKFCGIDTIQ